MIDLHCHILPGLDDGPRTWDESMEMARMAADDGVQVIVATPHVYDVRRGPEPELIREYSTILDNRVREAGLQLRILPGAEVLVSSDILDALAEGRLVTLGDRGRHLLVELPDGIIPAYANELFFRMALGGVTPLIAHVERLSEARRNPGLISDLAARGYGIQVNAASFTRREGRHVRRLVHRLAENGDVTIIASDGHNTKNRQPLMTPAQKPLHNNPGLFRRLTLDNPLAMLRPAKPT